MKVLFWSAAGVGLLAFALALGIYWAIRLEGTGALAPLIVFFVPLMMVGLSGAVVSNFVYYKKKELLSKNEKWGAIALVLASVLMMVLI